jgi:hypothetical protein
MTSKLRPIGCKDQSHWTKSVPDSVVCLYKHPEVREHSFINIYFVAPIMGQVPISSGGTPAKEA